MAHKTGMATKELAEHYGINVKSVRKVLRDWTRDYASNGPYWKSSSR
jgi:hypothetical protein